MDCCVSTRHLQRPLIRRRRKVFSLKSGYSLQAPGNRTILYFIYSPFCTSSTLCLNGCALLRRNLLHQLLQLLFRIGLIDPGNESEHAHVRLLQRLAVIGRGQHNIHMVLPLRHFRNGGLKYPCIDPCPLRYFLYCLLCDG